MAFLYKLNICYYPQCQVTVSNVYHIQVKGATAIIYEEVETQ